MKSGLIKIPLIFSLIIFSHHLVAQTASDSLPSYRMSEIVVLGDKVPEVTSATVHEIKKQQIRTLDVRNAGEAMQYTPGLYFSHTAKNEMSLRLRGFEQRQVSIYLDGVPISVPYDGLIDMSQLAGDNIESIRISKGVSSVLYGANTLGGGINIITGIPRKGQSLNLRMEASGQGRLFGGMDYSGSVGKLYFMTAFSLENAPNFRLPANAGVMPNENGGMRDNSDSRKTSASLKLHYDLDAVNRVGFHVNWIKNRFGVPPDAQTARPRYWRFPDWQKNVISLNSEHIMGGNFILRSVWYYDHYVNQLESYDDASYHSQTFKYAFSSYYNDYSLGGILYPEWSGLPFGATHGVLSFKTDLHRERASGAVPYDRYSMQTWTGGVEQDIFVSSHIQGKVGLDANYLRPTYANQSPLRDPILLMNGQAALQYQLAGKWAVHVTAGRKSRFPTLKELYSERLGRNIANPDLKAEHSLNLELGAVREGALGRITLSGFYSRLKDLIVSRQLGDNVQQYQNVGEALIWGTEAAVQGQWKMLNGMVNYTYLRAENRSAGRDSRHLEYRPTHRLNGIVVYSITPELQLSSEASYTAGQYYQNPDNGSWGKLNDFALFNLKAAYKFDKNMSVYFRVDNVTDKFYFSECGVPMPGREVISGFRFGI